MVVDRSTCIRLTGRCISAFALATALAGSASFAAVPQPVTRAFKCEDGRTFSITIQGPRARLRAGGASYELRRRAGSIAVRYGSDTVAFALDGDTAFLIGAAGGPYRGCKALLPGPRI